MTTSEFPSARAFMPPPERRGSLDDLRAAASRCRGCDIWEHATQTVFGEGRSDARLVLVGEQPGDREDLAGAPFVGPAGQLLDSALQQAGIDREQAFVTNVVKHFKWRPVPGGKRRLHDRPNRAEVEACVPWLEAELQVVHPDAVVLLGATAAQALLGSGFKVTLHRGEFLESPLAPLVMATIHPSAILRSRTDADREGELREFVADLAKLAAELARRNGVAAPPR